MRVYTTGRNCRVTPDLKRQLDERLAKLERFGAVREVHVILTVQKFRHVAEVLLNMGEKEIVCREEAKDMVSAIEATMSRLERQLKKLKERRSTRLLHDGTHTNGDESMGAKRSAARIAIGTKAGLGAAGKKAHAARLAESDEADAPALVAEGARVKKMTPGDAGTLFLAGGDPFLTFLNAETEELNIIYRRKDGRLGWVAPGGRRRPRG